MIHSLGMTHPNNDAFKSPDTVNTTPEDVPVRSAQLLPCELVRDVCSLCGSYPCRTKELLWSKYVTPGGLHQGCTANSDRDVGPAANHVCMCLQTTTGMGTVQKHLHAHTARNLPTHQAGGCCQAKNGVQTNQNAMHSWWLGVGKPPMGIQSSYKLRLPWSSKSTFEESNFTSRGRGFGGRRWHRSRTHHWIGMGSRGRVGCPGINEGPITRLTARCCEVLATLTTLIVLARSACHKHAK